MEIHVASLLFRRCDMESFDDGYANIILGTSYFTVIVFSSVRHFVSVRPFDVYIRLRDLQTFYAPFHKCPALPLRTQPGFRVLELGVDYGYLTLLLSDLVGNSGHVIATSKAQLSKGVKELIDDWLGRSGHDSGDDAVVKR